ncbi:MAG: hypothetical protein LBU65_06075 [Planctomycetaceae bacterium]|jgi:predicted esterase|nr:hypothetical protein [Planctomycetaceae bacterium]
MSNPNDNNRFEEPVEKRGFTSTERMVFSLFVLVIIGTAIYFIFAPTGDSPPPPPREIPLSPAVVEKISHGAVFLKYFRDGKFEKFSESKDPRFDNTLPTVVFIHGMGGHTDTNWIKELARRIRKSEPNTNIIGVDWSSVQTPPKANDSSDWQKFIEEQTGLKIDKKHIDIFLMPVETANKIPEVVNVSNDYLFDESGLHLNPSQTHIIGFSHGSHIAGMIGMKQAGKIKRITVLDPSTRAVHLGGDNVWGSGWDKNAAQFIDMYASSKWAGTNKIYGHRTFFVQEKKGEPPAWWDISKSAVFTTIEDHMYAAKWFLSTIGNGDVRFGYSISTESLPEEHWETIFSTLPKKGELDGIDEQITNEVVEGK